MKYKVKMKLQYFYFIFFCIIINNILAYKPVFLLHGVLTGNASMRIIAERIKELHPGTKIYSTDRFSGWSSLQSMWHQVQEIGNDLMNISKSHPKGIHFLAGPTVLCPAAHKSYIVPSNIKLENRPVYVWIPTPKGGICAPIDQLSLKCYSQGGLIARVILETFPEHNIKNFISLSAPQAGQYGTAFLHLFFPALVCKTAFELFYSRVGQHTSVGNYWNDPHHQSLYYNYSVFLPYTNNELLSSHSKDFKTGLMKLKKMVLIGGPDDGVITPWQSSQFGYYDKDENIVNLRERNIYSKDLIGLRTLDKKKKLLFVTVPEVSHFQWHMNTTVIDRYIIPYLD